MTLEDVAAIQAVMINVERLTEDALLLTKSHGLPSAFVLQVIALEEVGKVIHMRWKQLDRPVTRQGRTSHLQKQWAVACVLIGAKLLPHYKNYFSAPPEEQPVHFAHMGLALMDSDERRFFEEVIARNIEGAKQLGLYEDEDKPFQGVSRDVIDLPAIQNISDIMVKVLPLLKSEATLIVGSVFYEIMPPLQQAILDARDQ